MSADDFDDLPPLEWDEAAVPLAIDEAAIAREETSRTADLQRQTPIIQSIHASFRLNRMLDNKAVARRVWNCIFDPRRAQHGVQIVLRHPRTSTTVFPSGKVISLGAKSEASAIIACRKVARIIQKIPSYETVSFTEFKINNVTASGALGYRVDLGGVARNPFHEQFCHYDADQFPGLHYKLPKSLIDPNNIVNGGGGVKSEVNTGTGGGVNVKSESMTATAAPVSNNALITDLTTVPLTLTLYHSGKFTLVGASSEREVYQAFAWISRVFWPFAQQQKLSALAPRDSFDSWLAWADSEERRNTRVFPWENEERSVSDELRKREWKRFCCRNQPPAQAPVKSVPGTARPVQSVTAKHEHPTPAAVPSLSAQPQPSPQSAALSSPSPSPSPSSSPSPSVFVVPTPSPLPATVPTPSPAPVLAPSPAPVTTSDVDASTTVITATMTVDSADGEDVDWE